MGVWGCTLWYETKYWNSFEDALESKFLDNRKKEKKKNTLLWTYFSWDTDSGGQQQFHPLGLSK